MSFGEVGETTQTMSTGRVDKMHGVGIFDAVKILERQRLLIDTNWTVSQTGGSLMFAADILKLLQAVPDNESIITMFNFMRASVEITVRLNTNQFYYGALMLTLVPAGVGQRIDSIAMQAPSVLSAESAQAVIKKWDYAFPYEWLVPVNIAANVHPLILNCHVLAPLKFCSTCSPDNITLQVWGRYKDIELSYPTAVVQTTKTPLEFELPDTPFLTLEVPARVEKQSKVLIPKPAGSTHPATSGEEEEKDTVMKAVTALEHVTLGDAISHIPGLGMMSSALSFLVDKPDSSASQTRVVQDYNVDSFCIDVPDASTPVGYHRDRYQDPVPRRVPMSSNLTLSQYSQIPGLRGPNPALPTWNFTAIGDSTDLVSLIQRHPTLETMRIPLDYASLNAMMWRGSIKVMLQFFTTSFISARFVVQYHNPSIFADSPEDATYDSSLSRVVNVKGDTVDCFTLPWLHPYSWGTLDMIPAISVTLDSTMAAPCATASQIMIYMVMWVSGAEDIQFAMPRRINYQTEWTNVDPTGIEKQAMIHEQFQKAFPPIVENCAFDVDHAYATTEQIGSMSDYAKRYSLLPLVTGAEITPGFAQNTTSLLFNTPPVPVTTHYCQYYQFRQTAFGQMRSAFLFMSGGFRYRRYTPDLEYWVLTNPNQIDGHNNQSPGAYITTEDNMIRVSVPYSCYTPYQALGYYSGGYSFTPDTLDVSQTIVVDSTTPQWIAARDDIMFGWPILPTGLSVPVITSDEVKSDKGKEKEKEKDRGKEKQVTVPTPPRGLRRLTKQALD